MQAVVKGLYDAVMPRLSAQDQDQEVKEAAISCMAAAVALAGDLLQQQLPTILQVHYMCAKACGLHVGNYFGRWSPNLANQLTCTQNPMTAVPGCC